MSRISRLVRAEKGTSPEDVARSIWDDRYGSRVASNAATTHIEEDWIDYTRHPFLYAHAVSKPLTGDSGKWWLHEIATQYLVPAPARMLALGSGLADAEEYLLKNGFAGHIVAYEMSQNAVDAVRARVAKTAYASRFELRCGDVLDDALETASFDCVFVEAAIHHFERIEEMFRMMRRVLKPGGLLIFDEYVGPDHHQFPPGLVELMDRVNDCLDARYRVDYATGAVRESMPRPSLEFMLQHDPSEGVHSSQILPLTYQYFDVVERRDFGGAIVRPFFMGILQNFDFDDPKDRTVARLIILLEQELTRHAVLPHHNTIVVARPRAVPRAALSESDAARTGYADWSP